MACFSWPSRILGGLSAAISPRCLAQTRTSYWCRSRAGSSLQLATSTTSCPPCPWLSERRRPTPPARASWSLAGLRPRDRLPVPECVPRLHDLRRQILGDLLAVLLQQHDDGL